MESKIKLSKVARYHKIRIKIKFHKDAMYYTIGIKNQTSQRCKILHNWNQKSNFTINKIKWIYQENRGNHHRTKYQVLESCGKNLNEKNQENSLRNTKIYQSKGEFTPTIFYQLCTCKNITKTVTNISRSHSNFWDFCVKI